MMEVLLDYGWRLLSSRVGLAVLLCGLLWGWHVHDKRQAVASARDGFVRAFELAAAKAEVKTLRRKMAAAHEAERALQEKVQVAEGDALRFAAELEAYERETRVNSECVVDRGLLHRLRAN